MNEEMQTEEMQTNATVVEVTQMHSTTLVERVFAPLVARQKTTRISGLDTIAAIAPYLAALLEDEHQFQFFFSAATSGIGGLWRFAHHLQNMEVTAPTRLRRGAYHVWGYGRGGMEQATYFREKAVQGDLPPVLDVEDPNLPARATFSQRVTAQNSILSFLTHTARWSFGTPIIYTGRWYWTIRLPVCTNRQGQPYVPWAKEFPLWIASYTLNPWMPPDWSSWDFWQYAGNQRLPCGLIVDLNWWNGEAEELVGWHLTEAKDFGERPYRVVARDGVWLRSVPDGLYKRVLPYDTSFTAIALSENGLWLQEQLTGWWVKRLFVERTDI